MPTAATITGEMPQAIDPRASDAPQALRQLLTAPQRKRLSAFFDALDLERAGFTVGCIVA